MRFSFNKPKSILNLATGGLIPGLQEQMKAPKVPSADRAKADEAKAADEAARKLRAREKMRSGLATTISSDATGGQFASAGTGKKTLLGG